MFQEKLSEAYLTDCKQNLIDVEEHNKLEDKIPSYVGLSCAVSGYRSLNKYDAAIREGLQAQNSPTRIALPRGKDGKILHISSDILNKGLSQKPDGYRCVLDDSRGVFNLPHQNMSSENMDPSSKRSGSSFTRMVQKFSSVTSENCSSYSSTTEDNYLSNGSSENGSPSKSFIQQRIERLYGPAALGMVFCAKRAQLERKSPSPLKSTDEHLQLEGKESPPGMPSVFKHLRPEFRHQLPVKPKRSVYGSRASPETSDENSVSALQNGHKVRHIPIVLEKDDPLPSKLKDMSDKKVVKADDIQLNVKPKSPILVKEIPEPVQVKLGFKNALDLNRNVDPTIESLETSEIKDGHYFLKIVADEVSKLEPKIARIEVDLESHGDSMSEDVKGKVWAANGKAKLLINQKVDQFKGLCHKNIIKNSSEEFPTTNEDLAGFWDMVSIQVHHIKDLLLEVDQLRNNQWREVLPTVDSSKQKQPTTKSAPRKMVKKSSEMDSAKLKANEDRRKAMREAINAKRKAAAAATKANVDQVEIFVPTTTT